MATIKVSWEKLPTKVIDELMRDVKATAPKVLEAFSKEVEVSARRNFNRAINDISGDNPYVEVVRRISGNNATITCYGEQVLFAEFGAGKSNAYIENEIYVESHFAISSKNVLYYVQGYYKVIGLNARGFRNFGRTETMPRPWGIVPLGEYHSSLKGGYGNYYMSVWNGKQYNGSQGKNDFWVRPTQNGRMANRETHVHKKNGEIRPNVVWTMGTKPVRALYRARNTAINKLQSGRLKIK